MVHEQGTDSPGACQSCDYEKHEDEGWRQLIVLREAVHEPREHANDGDERDYFPEAPEGEEHAGDHRGRVSAAAR
jgi:hypothetical protein